MERAKINCSDSLIIVGDRLGDPSKGGANDKSIAATLTNALHKSTASLLPTGADLDYSSKELMHHHSSSAGDPSRDASLRLSRCTSG